MSSADGDEKDSQQWQQKKPPPVLLPGMSPALQQQRQQHDDPAPEQVFSVDSNPMSAAVLVTPPSTKQRWQQQQQQQQPPYYCPPTKQEQHEHQLHQVDTNGQVVSSDSSNTNTTKKRPCPMDTDHRRDEVVIDSRTKKASTGMSTMQQRHHPGAPPIAAATTAPTMTAPTTAAATSTAAAAAAAASTVTDYGYIPTFLRDDGLWRQARIVDLYREWHGLETKLRQQGTAIGVRAILEIASPSDTYNKTSFKQKNGYRRVRAIVKTIDDYGSREGGSVDEVIQQLESFRGGRGIYSNFLKQFIKASGGADDDDEDEGAEDREWELLKLVENGDEGRRIACRICHTHHAITLWAPKDDLSDQYPLCRECTESEFGESWEDEEDDVEAATGITDRASYLPIFRREGGLDKTCSVANLYNEWFGLEDYHALIPGGIIGIRDTDEWETFSSKEKRRFGIVHNIVNKIHTQVEKGLDPAIVIRHFEEWRSGKSLSYAKKGIGKLQYTGEMWTADIAASSDVTASSRTGAGRSSLKRKKPNSMSSLPSETVEYLKAWMMSPAHITNPYPTEQEKRTIIADTGIEMKQLTNWFVNNRKRFWKPRVAASAVASTNTPAAARMERLAVTQAAKSTVADEQSKTTTRIAAASRTAAEAEASSEPIDQQAGLRGTVPGKDDNTDLELRAFLVKLGLEKYFAKANEQEVDLETLGFLDENDFEHHLGLPLGPRRKILHYLASQKDGTTATAATADGGDAQVFLAKLGLGKYIAKVKEHEVDLETLGFLDENDLEHHLGLPLGPRRKILHHLANRKVGTTATAAAASTAAAGGGGASATAGGSSASSTLDQQVGRQQQAMPPSSSSIDACHASNVVGGSSNILSMATADGNDKGFAARIEGVAATQAAESTVADAQSTATRTTTATISTTATATPTTAITVRKAYISSAVTVQKMDPIENRRSSAHYYDDDDDPMYDYV